MSRGGFRGRGGRARFVPKQDKLSTDGSELQPPPLYPQLDSTPQPLSAPNDEWDFTYLLTLKQEYRAAMLNSPYYLRAPVKRSEIERYSDKYQQIAQNDSATQKWQPDWSRLPVELCVSKKKKKVVTTTKSTQDLKRKLDALQQREALDGEEEIETDSKRERKTERDTEEDAEDKEEDEDEDEVGGDEEEEGHESENDYNVNYYASDQSDGNDSNEESAYY